MDSYLTLKNEGNTLFSQGDYKQAHIKFSEALELVKKDKKLLSVLYSNLSSCSLNINEYYKAINEADECIRNNSDWYKGYFRKAYAYLKLNDRENFNICIEHSLELTNTDLERQEIEKFIENTKIAKKSKNLFGNIYEDKNSENEFNESVQNQYDWLMSQYIKPSDNDAFRTLGEYHEISEDEFSDKSAQSWIKYGEKYGCGDSPELLEILREYINERNPELKNNLLIKINKYIN